MKITSNGMSFSQVKIPYKH